MIIKDEYCLVKGEDYLNQIENIKKKSLRHIIYYDYSFEDCKGDKTFLFFRGQANYEWNLCPSITRQEKAENKMLNLVKEKNPHIEVNQLIAKAQHDGIPTRAIDFTIDIKVALYFACRDLKDTDGAIYICPYAPYKNIWFAPTVMTLISFMDEKELSTMSFVELIIKDENIRKIKHIMDEYYFDGARFTCSQVMTFLNDGLMVVFDYDKMQDNEKIKLQKGALFYCGCKINGNKRLKTYSVHAPYYHIMPHKIELPKWLEESCVKIRIPKELKDDIIKYIDLNDEKLGLNI